MLKYETKFIYVLEEAIAREKIKKIYADKENFSIISCVFCDQGDQDDSGFQLAFFYDEPKKEYNLEEDYVCSLCGKKNVKLWRPFGYSSPLICATCAEEHQRSCQYDEIIWSKNGAYSGKVTGKKLLLPKWKVDEKGRVPSYQGPGPNGKNRPMTYNLLVTFDYGYDELIPAVIEDFYEWRNRLATR